MRLVCSVSVLLRVLLVVCNVLDTLEYVLRRGALHDVVD